MFNQLGWQELAVILVLTLVVIGPERLPTVAAQAGRQLHQIRQWLKSMSAELKSELGPEFQDVDITSLNPKTFVKKHLLEDLDEDADLASMFTKSGSKASLVKAGVGAVVHDVGLGTKRGLVPLGLGEVPPWDPDTT